MSDNASWAGVVRAYLNSTTDAEADLNAKVLADLFEEVGDLATSLLLREKPLAKWVVASDEGLMDFFASGGGFIVSAEDHLESHCLFRARTPLEMEIFQTGVAYAIDAMSFMDDKPQTYSEYESVLEYVHRCRNDALQNEPEE